MSNQLVKKNPTEGYQNVFPKTWIDAIKDKESGVSLQEILQGFNMYFLSYNGSRALTRCKVPTILRKEGLWITYVLYDHTVVTEWYNSDQIDDNSWSMNSNWRVVSNNLVGDVSVSADGYWVINGEKTEARAQGEQGVTPLLRVGANNKLQVSYNAGKTWKDISDYIVPRFKWNQGVGTTAGTIQISMDLGKTWTNLSNEITNNLRISRYIGINESLPTSGIAEGTIYMKGPYYKESDTSNTNPIYRMWVYAWKGDTLAWQDNGEFTSISAGIVQEAGNSETIVMSQKAVTEKFTKLGCTTKESFNNVIKALYIDFGTSGYSYEDVRIGYVSRSLSDNYISIRGVWSNGGDYTVFEGAMENPRLFIATTTAGVSGVKIYAILDWEDVPVEGGQQKVGGVYDTGYPVNSIVTIPEKFFAVTRDGIINGIDNVPTNGSDNVVKSGGVKNAIDEIRDCVIDDVSFENVDNNHYINSSGEYTEYTNWARTYPIQLEKGNKLKFYAKGYNTTVAMIALVVDEENHIYKSVVNSTDSSPRWYEYMADKKCKVCLSYSEEVVPKAYIKVNIRQVGKSLSVVEGQVDEIISFDSQHIDSEHYINILGSYETLDGWARTYPIKMYKGDKIVYNAKGYSTTVAMIALVIDEGNHIYQSLVPSVDSTFREYTYIAEKECEVCLSYNTPETPNAVIYTYVRQCIEGVIESFENKIPINPSYIFQRLAVIGDSLSSGELVDDTSLLGDVYGDSWLSYLARKINASARTHYSHGGQTAKGWLLDTNDGLAKMQSDNAFGVYFIALGVNDSSNEAEQREGYYPLGTISDKAGTNSFVGYYKQIIEAIRTKAPNAVIFCVDLYTSNNTFTPYNKMISDICDLYDNAFFIPYSTEAPREYLLYSPKVSAGGHFTTFGYSVVADVIIKIMNKIVNENYSYFKFYGLHNSVGDKFEN